MTRQSITLTEKNDSWLKLQVNSQGDYANKSELVNDLIRRARRAELINAKLAAAEKRDFVTQTKAEILAGEVTVQLGAEYSVGDIITFTFVGGDVDNPGRQFAKN